MKFSDPYMFYLVWVVFLLGCVLVYGSRKRRKILSDFAADKIFNSIIPGCSAKRRHLKNGFIILAFLFIVIALSGPLIGFRWEKIEQKGVDIMICLDCSRSMLASDIKPNRLERAKHEIIDLLRMMHSDRAGLVAFAGDAVLQCPLTMDYSAFNIFLNALNPDYLPVGGTDLNGAIETALNGFEKNYNSDKAVILITDGENTSGKPLEAAEKAAKLGVKIFCIGVGSLDGAPVPDKNGGFKKDSGGRIIMSKVDDKGLKKIAAITNGRYVRSVAGNMDLDIIYNQDINRNMKKKTLKSTRKKIWENRFQWFLFPALILLAAEILIDEKKKPHNLIVFFLFFSMVFFSTSGNCNAGTYSSVKKGIIAFSKGEFDKAEKNFIDAQLNSPTRPDLYYDIGTAAYKRGDFKSALKNFKKALDTKDTSLKNKALYNLANTEYKMGNLEKAVQNYEKVLKRNPKNKNAKENLEFVKKKMKEKKEKKNSTKNNNQTDKKKKKNTENKNKNAKDKKNPGKQRQDRNSAMDKNRKNTNNSHNQDKNQQRDNPVNKTTKKSKNENNSRGNKEKNKPGKKMKDLSMNSNDRSSGEKGRNKKHTAPLDKTQLMMLNRLKDIPGRAMIPAYGAHKVEKDW